MGTWSNKPFGNDSALDWLSELSQQTDSYKFILETLNITESQLNQSATGDQEAIAAIAVVSASSIEPIGTVYKDAKAWIATHGFVPDKTLINLSKSVLDAICNKSELYNLWKESSDLKSWLKETRKLIANLDSATDTSLLVRVPKQRGLPRLLYKLIEYYNEQPSEKIREKIKEKFTLIVEPDKATNDTNYDAPLLLTSKFGLLEETKILLEKGANPNPSSRTPNLFATACGYGHVEVAEMLRNAGAKIFYEVSQETDGIILYQYQIRGIEPKKIGYKYCLALFSVARIGKPYVAEYLIGLGADLNQSDLNGENLLHKASEGGNIDMIDYLLGAGIDINSRKGSNAESALHFAVKSRKIAAVEYLLAHGANPNIIDKFEGQVNHWNETPLDLIKNEKDSEIFNVLRRHNALTAEEIMGSNYVSK